MFVAWFVVHFHEAGTDPPSAEEGSWIVRTQSGIAGGLDIRHFFTKNHEFARYQCIKHTHDWVREKDLCVRGAA